MIPGAQVREQFACPCPSPGTRGEPRRLLWKGRVVVTIAFTPGGTRRVQRGEETSDQEAPVCQLVKSCDRS